MGNRANYVLIEEGHQEIYFSRWGAPSIPSVLLSGPDATIAYVRALSPAVELLDEVWAEGGMLLNIVNRQLRFFGGVKIASSPYLRRPFLRVLRLLWPGWTVEWAILGIADLALGLGWEVGRVLDTEFDDRRLLYGTGPLISEKGIQVAHQFKQARSVISVRWPDQRIADYLLSPGPDYILTLGPRLLNILRTQPEAQLPEEGDPDLPHEGAYLDAWSQTLWAWVSDELDPRYVQSLTLRWPGWQVRGHADGLALHVAITGRDPTPKMVPETRAIDELLDKLTRESSTDPARLHRALSPEGEQWTYGKGFFSADKPPQSTEERRNVLRRLFDDWPAVLDAAPE